MRKDGQRPGAKRTFDCPFILDNDSNAALIGELTYGCAQDTKDAVMMIFGTGVGAAAVMDGKGYASITEAIAAINDTEQHTINSE